MLPSLQRMAAADFTEADFMGPLRLPRAAPAAPASDVHAPVAARAVPGDEPSISWDVAPAGEALEAGEAEAADAAAVAPLDLEADGGADVVWDISVAAAGAGLEDDGAELGGFDMSMVEAGEAGDSAGAAVGAGADGAASGAVGAEAGDPALRLTDASVRQQLACDLLELRCFLQQVRCPRCSARAVHAWRSLLTRVSHVRECQRQVEAGSSVFASALPFVMQSRSMPGAAPPAAGPHCRRSLRPALVVRACACACACACGFRGGARERPRAG